VTRFWGDLVARIAGLQACMLSREQLSALARETGLEGFATRLEATGRLPVPVESPRDPCSLERAFRRAAAAPLAVVGRWIGPRHDVISLFYDDEDRRSIRALLRGAAAGVPAAVRIAGLVPTPALPQRALEELAGRPTIGDVAASLVAMSHPFGAIVRAEATRPKPDLLVMETSLRRYFAEHALRAAGRAPRGATGRRMLVQYVQRSIDLENAWVALQLNSVHDPAPAPFFVDGGRMLDRATFEAAVSADDAASSQRLIDQAFAGSPLAGVVSAGPEGSERALISMELAMARRQRWLDPVGIPRIVEFFMRLRGEARDLTTVLWHTSLGAPFDPAALVTP
jgi:vacuolar-type H+-ATPase subunit C/Vma6